MRVHEASDKVAVLTVPKVVVGTGMRYQTANNALSALEDMQTISEITGRERNRTDVYRKYLNVLSEMTEL